VASVFYTAGLLSKQTLTREINLTGFFSFEQCKNKFKVILKMTAKMPNVSDGSTFARNC